MGKVEPLFKEVGGNPFGLEDDRNYDRNKRYTRSTNKFDHSRNIQCPFPTDIAANIHYWVSREFIPEYRSPQDLIRDAVYHHLRYLGEYYDDEQTINAVNDEVFLCEQDRLRDVVKTRRKIVTDARETFRLMQESEDWGMLREAIRAHEAKALELPEPYRSQLEREIEAATRALKGK